MDLMTAARGEKVLVRTGLALFSEAASCVTDDCGFRNLTGERFSYKI